MSLVFTHYDNRTQKCDHDGTLGKPTENGTRMCVRCGELLKEERFTKPTGRESGRQMEASPLDS